MGFLVFSPLKGRILLINIEIDENIFTLVNLYANNVEKNRNAFFKKVNISVLIKK
jgi:hypothetical protein